MLQSFYKGHDGVPAERNTNMSSRTWDVQEHRTMTGGVVERMEVLLYDSTTDNDQDQISDDIDTFRTFANKTLKTRSSGK